MKKNFSVELKSFAIKLHLCALTLSVSSAYWVKSDHKIDHWTISEQLEGGKLFSVVSSSSYPQGRFVMMLTLMIIECKIRCEVISLSLHDGKWAFIFHQFVPWNGALGESDGWLWNEKREFRQHEMIEWNGGFEENSFMHPHASFCQMMLEPIILLQIFKIIIIIKRTSQNFNISNTKT